MTTTSAGLFPGGRFRQTKGLDMHTLPVQPELINSDYPALVRSMSAATRLALFGVTPESTTFRCPATGYTYDDLHPLVVAGGVWTKCGLCDIYGKQKGQAGYRKDEPQPHWNPLLGGDQ